MIEKTKQIAAGELAGRIVNQLNNSVKAAKNAIDNGTAAIPQLGIPALTAQEISDALGQPGIAKINAAYNATL